MKTRFLRRVAVGTLLFAAVSSPGAAQEFLPEPDITYFGDAPAGSQISIVRQSDTLSTATGADPYVLRVEIVDPLVSAPTPSPAIPPAGTAYVGDVATVLVDGVAQGQVNLTERGAVFRLDFPQPARTPSPGAMLEPVRVVPTVPPTVSCGDVTCTPTRTRTPTPTWTPTGNTPGTPTPTRPPSCLGDCDANGNVSVSELVLGLNIALQRTDMAACPAFDDNSNDRNDVNELVEGVDNALTGCP